MNSIRERRRGRILTTGWGSGLTLDQYIRGTLSPILYYDGTLNGSNIANLGSAGSALDGTTTAVTIDANGMNFNGTTSKIVVPDHAALQALATYTVVGIVKANGFGENNAGEIFHLGALNAFRITGTAGRVTTVFDTNATDAGATTNDAFISTGVGLALFNTYDDAGDRRCHLYRGIAGIATEATYSTFNAATGTRVTPVGAIVGNFSDVRTWDGIINKIFVCNRLLTPTEMNNITTLAASFLV